MAMPFVVTVMSCWDLLKDTAIWPSKPPPLTLRLMEFGPTLPEALPEALKVRSSHSPVARLPLILSRLRMWIGFFSLLHWMAIVRSLPPPE